jgi:hypothetical protein
LKTGNKPKKDILHQFNYIVFLICEADEIIITTTTIIIIVIATTIINIITTIISIIIILKPNSVNDEIEPVKTRWQ